MSASNMQSRVASVGRLLSVVAAFAAFVPGPGQAAAPGIVGSSFSLVASAGYTTQPDGALIYTWGYGCASPTGHTYAPAVFQSIGSCPTMQLPGTVPAGCVALGGLGGGGAEFRLAPSAYDHAATCYDREYLFQFGEIDPAIHQQAEAQIKAIGACPPGTNNTITGMPCPPAVLAVPTEPYHPRYYTINGRSMPDNMDADYAPN